MSVLNQGQVDFDIFFNLNGFQCVLIIHGKMTLFELETCKREDGGFPSLKNFLFILLNLFLMV